MVVVFGVCMRVDADLTDTGFGVSSELVHANIVKLLRVGVQNGPNVTICLFVGDGCTYLDHASVSEHVNTDVNEEHIHTGHGISMVRMGYQVVTPAISSMETRMNTACPLAIS